MSDDDLTNPHGMFMSPQPDTFLSTAPRYYAHSPTSYDDGSACFYDTQILPFDFFFGVGGAEDIRVSRFGDFWSWIWNHFDHGFWPNM